MSAPKNAAQLRARDVGRATMPYARASVWRSCWQLVNTIPPLCGLWCVGWLSLDVSYALTLVCVALIAGLYVRITIFQHDCGHYAFFRSRWANEALGHFCTLFTLTPLAFWLHHHADHHSKINNLERGPRGVFAECLTVREYFALPWPKRIAYRAIHHPLVFFPLISPLMVAIATRFPIGLDKSRTSARRNVYVADVALVGVYGGLGLSFGWLETAMIQLPILVLGSAVGLWIDHLGHKFQASKWVEDDDWRLTSAAMEGCGHFKLPKVLQWFSGNIGIHHVHHLNPKIPNYFLQRCHDENVLFHAAKTFGLRQGIAAARLALWDDDRGRLIAFTELANRDFAAPGREHDHGAAVRCSDRISGP